MAKKITVRPNQSALDMVLETCGTLEGALDIMAANDRSICDNARPGTQYTIPEHAAKDNAVLLYLQQNKVRIGTRN